MNSSKSDNTGLTTLGYRDEVIIVIVLAFPNSLIWFSDGCHQNGGHGVVNGMKAYFVVTQSCYFYQQDKRLATLE